MKFESFYVTPAENGMVVRVGPGPDDYGRMKERDGTYVFNTTDDFQKWLEGHSTNTNAEPSLDP